MSKAEERALSKYPVLKTELGDINSLPRIGFIEGYQQAEKDFSLTSDDINDIIRIYEDVLETKSGENIYIEVLNRFNKQKGK